MSNLNHVSGHFLAQTPVETKGSQGVKFCKIYLDLTENPKFPITPEFQVRGHALSQLNGVAKGDLIQVWYKLTTWRYRNKQTGDEGIMNFLDLTKIDRLEKPGEEDTGVVMPTDSQPKSGPFG